jgi:hypothetical protein
VKLLVVSIAILVIVSFIFLPCFGQMPPGREDPMRSFPPGYGPPQLRERKPEKKPVSKKTTDANAIADANAATDANAVRARIEEFEGLGRALSQVSKEGKGEINEWTRSRGSDKIDLVQAVQEQVRAELNFLRELAVEEKAVKTAAAIDGLLLDRQERFKGVITKLEEEREKLRRRSELEERKARDEDRGGRRGRREREPRRRDRDNRSRRGVMPPV